MNEILHHIEIMETPLCVGIHRGIINSGDSYVVQDFVHPQSDGCGRLKEAPPISKRATFRKPPAQQFVAVLEVVRDGGTPVTWTLISQLHGHFVG